MPIYMNEGTTTAFNCQLTQLVESIKKNTSCPYQAQKSESEDGLPSRCVMQSPGE